MAEVLSLPRPDDRSHFGAGPLHRSSSQTTLLLHNPSSYTGSSPDLRAKHAHYEYDTRHSASVPSSAPSSPRWTQPDFSNQPSYLSTPSSSLSLDEPCSSDDDDLTFPSYDGDDVLDPRRTRHIHEPPPSPADPISPEPSRSISSAIVHTENGQSPSLVKIRRDGHSELLFTIRDDFDVRREPTRHVDYLSHIWKEEDIWTSWRHVVGKREDYSNSSRLENASWRTWAKARFGLPTVSPERLNWYVATVCADFARIDNR